METTEEEGWVTGPALETVLALKAIQPGDGVRVKNLLASFDPRGNEKLVDTGTVTDDFLLSVRPTIDTVREAVLLHRVRFVGGSQPGSWWIWKPSEVVAWKPKKRS